MRINSIGAIQPRNVYRNSGKVLKNEVSTETTPQLPNLSFKGKHTYAKGLGAIFGTLGSLGAISSMTIMSDVISVPLALAYVGLSAVTGVVFGHELDRSGSGEKDKNPHND